MKTFKLIKHFFLLLLTLNKVHLWECMHYFYGTIDNTIFNEAVNKRLKTFEYYNN